MNRLNLSSGRIFSLLYLSGLSLFIVKLLVTGEITSFVHPRFIPFLWGGAVISLLIIVCSLLPRFCVHAPTLSWKKAAILFIPLLFAFTVPPDASSIADDTSPIDSFQSNDSHPEAVPEPVVHARASAGFPLDETHFYMILTDMYDSPALYRGKRVRLTGMVFHRKNAPQGECAVLRMMMTCCAADLQPVGLVCVMPQNTDFAQKTWVNVEGILDIQRDAQGDIPVIRADKAERTEKPAQEYVYPI